MSSEVSGMHRACGIGRCMLLCHSRPAQMAPPPWTLEAEQMAGKTLVMFFCFSTNHSSLDVRPWCLLGNTDFWSLMGITASVSPYPAALSLCGKGFHIQLNIMAGCSCAKVSPNSSLFKFHLPATPAWCPFHGKVAYRITPHLTCQSPLWLLPMRCYC